ncbi:MAG: hypothetical protein S4CHLAM81_01110 [Chlamydiales bacterium]|nr:hypothetical protein [Chlamydiales bacterium]MCH9634907.1 hypothetical protein [Chlamydiales bacterium]MCH9704119.1 DUF151 domain-containing protein [Chlamydiota bacterium]
MLETDELVAIKLEKVTQNSSYTCVILGTDEKRFAIYTTPQSGKVMQNYLTATKQERPYTHELINRMFKGFDIKLKQVVINDLEDTTYFARLFLEQKMGDSLHIVEIDARPSDCLTLAMQYKVPIFCTTRVLEEAIAYEE